MRKTGGTQAGYNTWRANFGQPSGSGSVASANAAVPEPSTLVMLVLAAVGVCSRRRWAAQKSPNKSWLRETSHQTTDLDTAQTLASKSVTDW